MESRSTQPLRVLHLEDNPRDAEIIRHKLELGGVSCDIVLVNSREAFQQALDEGAFDLILCDYNVPGYDGVSALTHAKVVRPDAPVIIISGTVGEEEAVLCLHSGATDYLLKQRLERLAPAVRRAIQEAEERRSRAHAEDALHQREQRLSSIYDAVADVIFYIAVDPDGGYRYVSVNPAFVVTTGLDSAAVVGRPIEHVIPAASLGATLEYFQEAIRERRVVRWEETSEYPRGRITGEVSVAPVFDADGRCTHLVGSLRDVTERRQLEAQLRQAQKLESVGLLAGGIAHDFNNLLTVINGMAELVLSQLERGGPGIKKGLNDILHAGERAAGLTRQLLAFSRKQILKPQIINLNTIVADMGNLLRRLLGEDVDLVIVPSQDAVNVKADPGQLGQVIANVAVNARDAMPTGGTLRIETRIEVIDDAFGRERGVTAQPGHYVVLAMSDTGVGMDDATRRHIFEPFFTTKGLGKGTGLGLSTVYGIVKQSDGFIWVDSTIGQGSCFTIYLPLVAEASTSRPPDEPIGVTAGHETVLVVEDVIALGRFIAQTLEGAGYKVLSASTGATALKLLEVYDPKVDLMITDVVMPGMSGRELAEKLRPSRPDMKVLYMSGYTDDVMVRHGATHDGRGFMSKPFGPKELLRRVREALDVEPLARSGSQ